MQANDLEVVIDHILGNKNNLEMALDVSFAYHAVRRRLIVTGLDELDRMLRQNLNPLEWDLDALLRDNPFEKYSGFFVTKRVWGGRYKIGISAEKTDAKGFIIGVMKAEEGSNPAEGLKAALDSAIRRGAASSWWDWYHELDHPFGDWDNKEILVSMYDGQAAKYLGAYLQRIVSAATPWIDRYLSASR